MHSNPATDNHSNATDAPNSVKADLGDGYRDTTESIHREGGYQGGNAPSGELRRGCGSHSPPLNKRLNSDYGEPLGNQQKKGELAHFVPSELGLPKLRG